jgi:hypothetical protein
VLVHTIGSYGLLPLTAVAAEINALVKQQQLTAVVVAALLQHYCRHCVLPFDQKVALAQTSVCNRHRGYLIAYPATAV